MKSKFIVISSSIDKTLLFNTFDNINYPYVEPKPFNTQEIYNYSDLVKDKKHLIEDILSLHNKSKEYVSISPFIEEIQKTIDNTYNYYDRLEETILYSQFPDPARYTLINNISIIYKSIELSKHYLSSANENDNIIESFVVNKINKIDDMYYLNYNTFIKNIRVYDQVLLYKYFNYLDVSLNNTEKNILYSLLLIPNHLSLESTNYNNTKEVRRLINYLNKTITLLEEDKKDKEADEDILKE